MVTDEDVKIDVRGALEKLIVGEIGIPFDWSIVPSKPLNQNGLNATSSGWWLLLEKMKSTYLNPRPEYSEWEITEVFVEGTLNEELAISHITITDELWAIAQGQGNNA